jgi:hypothetical protein
MLLKPPTQYAALESEAVFFSQAVMFHVFVVNVNTPAIEKYSPLYHSRERRIAVSLITPLIIVTLIFASCSSGPASAPDGSPAVESAAAPVDAPDSGRTASSGKIPVEKKALVKFADGTLDEYTVSEYDSADITLLEQNRFSASGALMDQVAYSYDERNRVLTTKMTKDEENRLKSRIVYEYNARADLLLRETIVNKAGKPVSVNEYTYNDNGTVASRIILNGANVRLAKTVYTYNPEGDLILSSQTENGLGKPISSSKNTYDETGNLVNQEIRNAAGTVTRRIATVWKDGREFVNTQTTPGGKIQLRTTNEYGSAGELLKKIIENIQGNSVQIMEYEYVFRSSRGRT